MREWRSVQDERPSCSTSGGQSFGGAVVFVMDLVTEEKSAKELQDRQLTCCQYSLVRRAYGVGFTVCHLFLALLFVSASPARPLASQP